MVTPSDLFHGWHGGDEAVAPVPHVWLPGKATGGDGEPVDMSSWITTLVGLDTVVALVVALVTLRLRFGGSAPSFEGMSQFAVATVTAVLWLISMTGARAYEREALAVGPQEYRRVCHGAVWLMAVVAIAAFAVHVEISRSFLAITVPATATASILGRCVVRQLLKREITAGRPLHRVVVIGSRVETADFVRHMARVPHAGFRFVGACIPGESAALAVPDGEALPVVGTIDSALREVRSLGADTVAVAGREALPQQDLRRLSWGLEGTGVSLVVAPAVTDVAGPRIRVRPMQGLPLLHIDEPRFTGGSRVLKEVLDRGLASIALVLTAPLLAVLALAICATSPGAPLFRQTRVGLNGREFVIWKLRTMVADADAHYHRLVEEAGHHGILFKLADDPRITPLGRWLRRLSLDELPQLWNVLTGSMSLVGPRPQRASEVAGYGHDDHRRLLVKPGMTGLWQVSGRSELTWEETVQLDLQYVDHWSVWLDLTLLLKTVGIVLRPRGAF